MYGVSDHHVGGSRVDILLWTLEPDKPCLAVVFRHQQCSGLTFLLDLWQFSDSDLEVKPKQKHGDTVEAKIGFWGFWSLKNL